MQTIIPNALTPVEKIDGMWLKRDDAFRVGKSCGGKVRTCLRIASDALMAGAHTLVTAGSRQSPQVNIVATVARELGMMAECHVPSGEFTPELEAAQQAGATIIQHHPGYNSVICARAKKAAEQDGYYEVPFGMETPLAVNYTALQVANLPFGDFRRLVVPVGSGMSLAGILHGLERLQQHTPVIGVQVGAECWRRLDKYAPTFWREQVSLHKSFYDYHKPAARCNIADVQLDSIYEAKCLPYLQPGDLLWVVGVRETELVD